MIPLNKKSKIKELKDMVKRYPGILGFVPLTSGIVKTTFDNKTGYVITKNERL